MRRRMVAGTVLALAAGMTGTAAADRPGRYTMSPAGEGFVRLDTETGDVSFCSRRDGDWSCRMAPDAEAALRKENERLAAENRKLKDEMRQMEEAFGLGPPGPETGKPPSGGKIELPREEDIDKAFDYFESMVRKFRERLKRFETEPHGPPPKPEPLPPPL